MPSPLPPSFAQINPFEALDVPVGFGRIALEQTAADVAVTGVDQSSTILEEAGRRAASSFTFGASRIVTVGRRPSGA